MQAMRIGYNDANGSIRNHYDEHLVTGSAGFVGSNLAHALVARGDKVTILDNFSTGRLVNLAGIRDRLNWSTGVSPIEQPSSLRSMGLTWCSISALPSVPKSEFTPETNEANVVGTLTLLECCRQASISRFVYAASSNMETRRGSKERD